MQVKDKEAETLQRDLKVWGQLGGGALINVGQGPQKESKAEGGTQARVRLNVSFR